MMNTRFYPSQANASVGVRPQPSIPKRKTLLMDQPVQDHVMFAGGKHNKKKNSKVGQVMVTLWQSDTSESSTTSQEAADTHLLDRLGQKSTVLKKWFSPEIGEKSPASLPSAMLKALVFSNSAPGHSHRSQSKLESSIKSIFFPHVECNDPQVRKIINETVNQLKQLEQSEAGFNDTGSSSQKLLEDYLDQLETSNESASPQGFIHFLRQVEPINTAYPSQVYQVAKLLNEMLNEATIDPVEAFQDACPTVFKYGRLLEGVDDLPPMWDPNLRAGELNDALLLLSNPLGHKNLLIVSPAGQGKTVFLRGLAAQLQDRERASSHPAGPQVVGLNLEKLSLERGHKEGSAAVSKKMLEELQHYLRQNPRQKLVVLLDDMQLGAVEDQGVSFLDHLSVSPVLGNPQVTWLGTTKPEQQQRIFADERPGIKRGFQLVLLKPLPPSAFEKVLAAEAEQLSADFNISIFPSTISQVRHVALQDGSEDALNRGQALLSLAVQLADKERLQSGASRERNQQRLNLQHVQSASRLLMNKPASMDLHQAKAVLCDSIVGQPVATSLLTRALERIDRIRRLQYSGNKPLASFLLCGPTGTGKTEAAKLMAQAVTREEPLRLDMSEYQEPHSLSKLLGAPPGYQGYQQGGLLSQIRQTPNRVVLFDEIEKAHPDILNVLLQMLDYGEVSDSQGAVSFKNSIVILTSNLSQKEIADKVALFQAQFQNVGKTPGENATAYPRRMGMEDMLNEVRDSLRIHNFSPRPGLKPEILGRIEHVVPYNYLKIDDVDAIIQVALKGYNQKEVFSSRNLTLKMTPQARLVFCEQFKRQQNKAFLPEGARQVRRALDTLIETQVLPWLLPSLTSQLPVENGTLNITASIPLQRFKVEFTPQSRLGWGPIAQLASQR